MARILVVDDSDEVRELVGTVLTAEGHRVSFAADGDEALEMMEQNRPDLLVLDIMMPGKDGYNVLQEMRETGLRGQVKILILTAKGTETDWVKGYKLGADQYLTKPFELAELLGAVDHLLAMSKDQLGAQREQEIDKAKLLSRLENMFDQ